MPWGTAMGGTMQALGEGPAAMSQALLLTLLTARANSSILQRTHAVPGATEIQTVQYEEVSDMGFMLILVLLA